MVKVPPHPSGEKYMGSWLNDKRNGQGASTFANGEEYVGVGKIILELVKEVYSD